MWRRIYPTGRWSSRSAWIPSRSDTAATHERSARVLIERCVYAGAWPAHIVASVLHVPARALHPDDDQSIGLTFGGSRGAREYRLFKELHNRWLLWRDELIVGGTTAPANVKRAPRAATVETAQVVPS